MWGLFWLFLLVVLIVANAWPVLGLVVLLGLYLCWRRAEQKWLEKQQRLHQAELTQRIARRQRDLAASDAVLGLGSALLSKINADTLDRLAKVD